MGDLGEEHGDRVLRVCGKGSDIVLVPLPRQSAGRSTAQQAPVPAARSCSAAAPPGWTGTPPPDGSRLAEHAGIRSSRAHPHMLRPFTCHCHARRGVDIRDVQIAARHADPRTTMHYDRARKNLGRHPNYVLAAFMASGTWPGAQRILTSTMIPASAESVAAQIPLTPCKSSHLVGRTISLCEPVDQFRERELPTRSRAETVPHACEHCDGPRRHPARAVEVEDAA
jgi:integrase-like protein